MKPTMKDGDCFKTRYDDYFFVIDYIDCENVFVRFESTGWIGKFSAAEIRKGNVKDRMKKTCYGVGFIGDGKYRTGSKSKNFKCYDAWRNMLSRCYNKGNKFYKNYGGKGVVVCDEWHNFQNFAEWYYDNAVSYKFHIDKDLLSKDVKIYSPGTCSILTPKENSRVSFVDGYADELLASIRPE